jgi:hypothetical protein
METDEKINENIRIVLDGFDSYYVRWLIETMLVSNSAALRCNLSPMEKLYAMHKTVQHVMAIDATAVRDLSTMTRLNAHSSDSGRSSRVYDILSSWTNVAIPDHYRRVSKEVQKNGAKRPIAIDPIICYDRANGRNVNARVEMAPPSAKKRATSTSSTVGPMHNYVDAKAFFERMQKLFALYDTSWGKILVFISQLDTKKIPTVIMRNHATSIYEFALILRHDALSEHTERKLRTAIERMDISSTTAVAAAISDERNLEKLSYMMYSSTLLGMYEKLTEKRKLNVPRVPLKLNPAISALQDKFEKIKKEGIGNRQLVSDLEAEMYIWSERGSTIGGDDEDGRASVITDSSEPYAQWDESDFDPAAADSGTLAVAWNAEHGHDSDTESFY